MKQPPSKPNRFERLADSWLVLEAQSGDGDAFRMLAQRWQERLWRHAQRVTQREDLAWDVSQDAWLVIVNGLHKLSDVNRFGSWALSIVSRRALDALRREGRVDSLQDPDTSVEAKAASQAPEGSPRDLMGRALALLPPEQRALLALHHVEELGLDELAASLDVPIGTVKSRLHTARESLRATLLGMMP